MTDNIVLDPQPIQTENPTTLLSLILDESGSMMPQVDKTIEGINEYINGQKNTQGECYFTLTKFDSPKVEVLWDNLPINDVPLLTQESYRPNGMTNLLDAIGTTINKVQAKIDTMKEKPAVLISIMTDGHENASREWTNSGVKSLIEQKTNEGWTFTFMGAGLDAFAISQQYGISAGNTRSFNVETMATSLAEESKVHSMYRSSGAALASARGVSTKSLYADNSKVFKS